MMRRNRKHRVHGRIVSVHAVGLSVLVVFVLVGYLAMDNRCGARGQLIKDLERRYASLEEERIREEAKWNAMKTPDAMNQHLLRNGLSMTYARPEQIIRMPRSDSAVALVAEYQERERSARVSRRTP